MANLNAFFTSYFSLEEDVVGRHIASRIGSHDPDGVTRIARRTKRGWRVKGRTVVPGRDEYYDYSF